MGKSWVGKMGTLVTKYSFLGGAPSLEMIRDCEGRLSTDGIFDYMLYYILIVSILNRIGFRFKIHADKTTIKIHHIVHLFWNDGQTQLEFLETNRTGKIQK